MLLWYHGGFPSPVDPQVVFWNSGHKDNTPASASAELNGGNMAGLWLSIQLGMVMENHHFWKINELMGHFMVMINEKLRNCWLVLWNMAGLWLSIYFGNGMSSSQLMENHHFWYTVEYHGQIPWWFDRFFRTMESAWMNRWPHVESLGSLGWELSPDRRAFLFARELWWVAQMNMGEMDENGWKWWISPWISWDFSGIWWEYVWEFRQQRDNREKWGLS